MKKITKFFDIIVQSSRLDQAKIHVWIKLKLNKKAPISTHIFSAVKPNEQLVTDSQANG